LSFGRIVDVAFLSLRQIWALLAATVRELLWGLPLAAGEVRHWRTRALTIPDPPLRVDAMHSLLRKRANTDGSVLFSILTHRRNHCLLRLLVAYESIWDFLDNVSERGAHAGDANGRRLHRALLDAVDTARPISGYYIHHPWKDDAGYLRALVAVCRECCLSLPSYGQVRRPLLEEGRRSDVGTYNHEPDPARRDVVLRRWVERERHVVERERHVLTAYGPVAWYELSAAASCSAAAHVMLALAADPERRASDVAAVYAVYFPWFSVATTMLDSYVDQAEDAAGGAHIYIAHYPCEEAATRRVCELVRCASDRARALPGGQRHAVIVACMVAMYLSKDSARAPHMRASTASLVRAGGPLARALVPVLRLWRIVYGQRTA
jgi:tetraprenyl-beta-curcumene synthase